MSEQDNLQKVRRAYKAFTEGDLATLLSLVTNDVEFLPPVIASVPWAHPWRGREEVEQYFKTLAKRLSFRNSPLTNSLSVATPSSC
jgi:ketosteroid isomerase-like protein